MKDSLDIRFRPIGTVNNSIKERKHRGWEQVESQIILLSELTASADGLEKFSHIIVVFWMHQNTGDIPAKVRPQGREDMPLLGVLATRSPRRPNNIGMTVARLLERRENVLTVVGLDAINQTPVLDIKPYLPGDSIADAQYPEWVHRLREK